MKRMLFLLLAVLMILLAPTMQLHANAAESGVTWDFADGVLTQVIPAPGDVAVNKKNFPDDNFRAWILSQDYGKDAILTQKELTGVSVIDVYNKGIADLTGIEYFTALSELYCYDNQITSLDLRNNTKLRYLYCYNNALTALDVRNLTALEFLLCHNNQLTALDVSTNIALRDLSCSENQITLLEVKHLPVLKALLCYNNQLTALDVSKNTALRSLHCDSNQITSLDVQHLAELEELSCYSNQLTALDVSNNTNLNELMCDGNQLTELDVSSNILLETLHCRSNEIAELDVSNHKELTSLMCDFNQLSALDVTNNPKLETLWCDQNQISELDLRNNTALVWVICRDNLLTELNVDNNVLLEELWCEDNQITELNVSNNKALRILRCFANELTMLDVSKNPLLTTLWCSDNQITSLDVSQNTKLEELYCNGNQLTELDVTHNSLITQLQFQNNRVSAVDLSQNNALRILLCSNNQLTELDVSQNTLLETLYCGSNYLTSLDLSNNPQCTDVYAENNRRQITLDNNNAFDLSTLPGFDVNRADNWNGATVNGNMLTAEAVTITYSYQIDSSRIETFTLQVSNYTPATNVTWTYDAASAALIISGTGAMEDHSMPWSDLREEIRSVVIEEGITYVGAYAFYECPNLTQVTLPLSVTAMGDQAFSDCPVETSYYAGAPSQWEEITQNNSGPWNSVVYCEKAGRDLTWDFADGVLTVSGTGEMDGFSNMTIAPWEGLKSRIETVVIREGVTSVNSSAFHDCTALTAVTIPKTVIELNGFSGENSLQAITVDQDNPAYTSEDGILFNKDKTVLIQYPFQKADTRYSIPEGVTEIRNGAFENSDNLTWVTFPESLRILGHFAFRECDGLRHVIIPGHVTELGYCSFQNCTGLESVEVESGITDLPMFMFEGCASLEEVTLPDTLINIWENTFAYCTSLKRLKLPAGMNFISDGAFHDSTALEEIIIGGVREIYWGIGGCTALKKVIFLGDAPSHCEQAFYEATLTAYYPAGNATWTDAVRESFGGNVTWIALATSGTCGDDLTWSFDNGTLTISGTGDMYDYSGDQTNPAPWAQFGDDMEILVVEEGVTGIGDNAFDGCAIMEGHFPGTLVSVGDSAGLRGLAYINQTVRRWSKIYFGENNTGFPWWDAVRFVVEDPIVKSGKAGEHIYWELDKDGILVFFGNGEMYDFGATASPFAESSVKTVTIGEGITNIGANLFETWGSSALGKTLESVTVASSVTRVETMAFTDCKALKTVTFTGDAPSFGENCFRGVTATAYYPADNATWTAAVMQDYEGDITWLPYTHEHTFGEWITEDNLSTRTCTLCGYMEQKVTTDSGDVELELPDQPGLNADVVPVRPSDSDYVLVEEALNSAEEPNQKILKVFDINLKNSDGVHVQPDGAVKVKLPLDWEKEGNYKVYRVNDDGTLTDMNAYRQGSHMVFETDHFSLYVMVEVYEDNPFEDVALDQWYAAPVLWAVNQGITNGMTETTFAPDGTCTRAQIVTFLWRANGSPAPASVHNPFTDVPADAWYTDAVLWAVEQGITTGTSATTFSPDAGCTRGQVATFLWRAEGEPASGAENIFTDITPDAYYYDAVLWAVANEITNGMGDGAFAPDATCTRGQIVTFLYRAMA